MLPCRCVNEGILNSTSLRCWAFDILSLRSNCLRFNDCLSWLMWKLFNPGSIHTQRADPCVSPSDEIRLRTPGGH